MGIERIVRKMDRVVMPRWCYVTHGMAASGWLCRGRCFGVGICVGVALLNYTYWDVWILSSDFGGLNERMWEGGVRGMDERIFWIFV